MHLHLITLIINDKLPMDKVNSVLSFVVGNTIQSTIQTFTMGHHNYSIASLVQPVFMISLFLIFIKLFAWDACGRYARDEVMIQVSTEEPDTLDSPAVTICLEMVSYLVNSYC